MTIVLLVATCVCGAAVVVSVLVEAKPNVTAAVLSMFSVALAMLLGYAETDDKWQSRMIDAGCAHYHPQTGDWEWTGETCNPGVALEGEK